MGNVNAKDPDYWNVPESPPIAYINRNWMARLPNTQCLSQTSIPGTHDTMARASDIAHAWCQAWSLNDQMDVGIRFFDIRCRHFRNGLPIHHGLIYQNCNFNDCITAMIQFLDSNPSEVLIMRVKEEYDAAENTNTFADAVKDNIPGGRPDRFWMKDSIPTVGEARGKIVILTDFYCEPAIGIRYGDLDIEDHWDVSSVDNKWPKVQEHLQRAQRSIKERRNTMFLTFSSFSGGLIPRETARSMNPKLHKFVRDNRGPFGIIAIDYPGPKVIQDIINDNF